MDMIKLLIKYVNYPLARLAKGNLEQIASYRQCKKKQYCSLDEHIRQRNKKLYRIVMYAASHVPYYREIVQQKHLKFSESSIEEDIKKLPVLTKEIIRKEGNRMYSREALDYYVATSGGSTGEPVRLLHDDYLAKIHPGNYFLSFAGYDIGDKQLLLWGSERDILKGGGIGIKAEIANRFIHRRRMLNSFLMDETTMKKYIKIINHWKPKVILAYVQSIYELSVYIKKQNIQMHSPGGIVVTAGTLYKDWKELIEEVFRCRVLNQYGSRETSGIAISCLKSDRLHINQFLNYVEIADENGHVLPEDTDGEILVTNLVNKSMPLIRYRIGDIGALSAEKTCQCGRNLPCLKYVKGRTVNLFKRKDGAVVDGEYFTHLFYRAEGVKKFQVIQWDYDSIEVKAEMDAGRKEIAADTLEQMIADIRIVMGKNCEVCVTYVERLMPSKSGKFIYTICMI